MQRSKRLRVRVLSVLSSALILGLAVPLNTARAEVPTGPPTFSDPLDIDNLFFPFEPGGLKEFVGSDHGTETAALDIYSTDTRTFKWNGKHVKCRILVEEAYEDGELIERSFNYFAQADDGTVYYFGEVVDNYVDGVIDNHEGSWLVGGATLRTDPPEDEVGNADDPTVFMPANPEVGDVFKPEDLFPIVDETATVVAIDQDVVVSGTKYDDAIKIEETTLLDSSAEFKWYAPGVGVVRVQAEGERLLLVSSTLVQRQDDDDDRDSNSRSRRNRGERNGDR